MRGAPPLPNLIQVLYKTALQPLLFQLDAELVHDLAVKRLTFLQKSPRAKAMLERSFAVKDRRLRVTLQTLDCPNPVGLAAGFDTNAQLLGILPSLGFGFAETGTFTPKAQPGEVKPRLFRYKKQKALVNRMGFNNPGVQKLAGQFEKHKPTIPIGINIGKGVDTPLEKAVNDYTAAFKAVVSLADYIAINVSSPNTPGLRDLQALTSLKEILTAVSSLNRSMAEAEGRPRKPIFTKIAPDLPDDTIDDITRLCVQLGSGIIATNTTLDHSSLGSKETEEGGLSGAPLKSRSNQVLKNVYQITKGAVPLIGVGGISSANDAYEKIRLGASLVQVYTGWIYEGPILISAINRGLLKLMKRDGFQRIQEAVGTL